MTQTIKPSPRARYWRSLDELRQSPDFSRSLEREFPVAASEFPDGVSRRRWLQLMGASLAFGGVVGCRYPEETIAPFVIRPEGRAPGEPYSRATCVELAGRIYHLLVTCVDGRPLKIEGNPDHPSGHGGTDAYVQGSILGLYDPDRKTGVTRHVEGRRVDSSWEAFESHVQVLMESQQASGGKGFGLLVEPTASPSVVRLIEGLQEKLPGMTLCRYDSVRGNVMREATRQAIGRVGEPVFELGKAKVVLALQADPLGHDPLFVRNARAYAEGRDPLQGSMSRLYVVEAGFSATGAAADSRLTLRPSEMPAFLAELERRIDGDFKEEVGGKSGDSEGAAGSGEELAYDDLSVEQRLRRFLEVVAEDLAGAKEGALVVVGEHLGADAVAAGIRINHKLGSLGETVQYVEPVDEPLEGVSLEAFTAKCLEGALDTLFVLGGNPLFTAPADVDLAGAIRQVAESVYLGDYEDETAAACSWVLPAAHPLESWGDSIDRDGFYGVCQPQILPLLEGRSSIEVLALVSGQEEVAGDRVVRQTAAKQAKSDFGNHQWRKLLHDGFAEDLKAEISQVSYSGDSSSQGEVSSQVSTEIDRDQIEILFVPADGIYDGRFANNGWLQEMPQSLTKLTWDNAAIMSPQTARSLGVKHGLMVQLRRAEASVELPVYEFPGVAPGVVTVAYGYGRTRVGAVGGHEDLGLAPVGTDVRSLRSKDSMFVAESMEARPRPRKTYELATTQDHWAIDPGGQEETQDRSYRLVREGTKELLEKSPDFTAHRGLHVPPADVTTLWEEPIDAIEEDPENKRLPQWGMSVDLSKCIGCNACTIACQSENNVPIVGKKQVSESREMHWLRIDRYFQGDEDHVDIVQEPVACMHCEMAPCEQVCPVAATVHTEEGINAMAYNRCIGTRYCANNCPFKVRRFNYFNFNTEVGVGYGIKAFPGTIESANRKLQQLVLNPEVTVRGRGVMEKCTYCIQRVERAKIEARKDGGREIRDGDVQTACQTACPTRAIEFGNIADPDSKVAMARQDPRSYGMLPQIKVKPRTTYLSRIRNPHVRLMTSRQREDLSNLSKSHAHHGHDDPDSSDGAKQQGHKHHHDKGADDQH